METKIIVVLALFISLSLLLVAVAISTVKPWLQWNERAPSESYIRQQFQAHHEDYKQLAGLLQNDHTARNVSGDGAVDIDGVRSRLVPEYRDLMHKLGAKDVLIGTDGSVEFSLGGHGGTIMSDSDSGVLYTPKETSIGAQPGYRPSVVNSIADAKLPQEKGAVATGLYITPIEPGWYVYRFEYQE